MEESQQQQPQQQQPQPQTLPNPHPHSYSHPHSEAVSDDVHLSLLCRVCGQTSIHFIPIFEGEGLENNLSTKINSYLPLQVDVSDELPLQLCFQCASALVTWHNLYQCCLQTSVTLNSKLSKARSSNDSSDPSQVNLEESSSNSNQKRFTWFSWRVLFTLTCTFGSAIMTSLCLFRLFFSGIDIYKTISTMFYGSTLFVLVLFLRLAPHWPSLMMAVAEKERPRKFPRRSLRVRFSAYSFGILFPALIEHLLAVITCLSVAYDCNRGAPVLDSYFTNSFPQIFAHTDFTPWKGILVQFVNVSSTFNWNYMDLFLILVSLTLTDRFEQLNDRLDSVKGKNVSEVFWRNAREEYVHLSMVVKKIDKFMNGIVFLSFTNNIYFVCLQLFNSLKVAVKEGCICSPLRRVVHAAYFTFSFGFLVIRALTVALGTAKINTTAKHPTTIIYSVPSQTYGVEQRRFLEQVINDVIAFTGLNFFYITRGLVLTIAGTIVTYELVLVQFNSGESTINVNITSDDICGITIESWSE
ncbi:gustatory receptor for sugar taste 64f-like [Arctopsyche grandis]|uniref:gustatory receptor for sugar taste 64f-like n=1 Tax=Arctopsyche grandis TaxID=121162 RepID=UPI00406D7F25